VILKKNRTAASQDSCAGAERAGPYEIVEGQNAHPADRLIDSQRDQIHDTARVCCNGKKEDGHEEYG